MNEPEISKLPEVNREIRDPDNWEKHRREVRMQIMLPLAIGVFITILLAVLVTMGSFAQVSQWADVAVIWLAVPALFATLIIFVILAAFAYGMWMFLKVLPGYMAQIQDFFKLVNARISGITDKLVEPFLGYEGNKSSWRAMFKSFTRK